MTTGTLERDPQTCTAFWAGRQKLHTRDLHGRAVLTEIPIHHDCSREAGHPGLHVCTCGNLQDAG